MFTKLIAATDLVEPNLITFFKFLSELNFNKNKKKFSKMPYQ